MLVRIFKTFFIFMITSIFVLFFIGLYNFKKNILSFTKYNKESSNIVILTGGTNRIKDGLKIVKDFKKSKKHNYKILVSGTGTGFTPLHRSARLSAELGTVTGTNSPVLPLAA